MDFIKIEQTSHVPKYKQVIAGIHEAIENKELKYNQKIPSINEVSQKFGLSRDTVMTAFNHLQSRGIIISRPGKGYYIAKSTISQKRKIFLLFDKLTSYKETLFDSFRNQLKRQGTVEIYFHNFNAKTFETLIRESVGHYTDYAIMPIPSKSIANAVKLIPQDRLYILDRGRRLYGQVYPSVCQSFRKDIYNALVSGTDLLKKYKKLVMLIPELSHVPMDLQRGFKEYCSEYNMRYSITKKLHDNKII
ncbi:MAG: GntR family transcriptional regulator, partial [Ginsengibacter sp.]